VDMSESVEGDKGGVAGEEGCWCGIGDDGMEVRGDDATARFWAGALRALVCRASVCGYVNLCEVGSLE